MYQINQIKISHRGNLFGPNPENENKPSYLEATLSKGYNVEVDVWKVNGELFLGHDKPDYKINESFLENKNFWCHAKNLNALEHLLKLKTVCFWHQKDDYTLTSNGYIWTYPEKIVSESCILVIQDDNKKQYNCAGICSDYIGEKKC